MRSEVHCIWGRSSKSSFEKDGFTCTCISSCSCRATRGICVHFGAEITQWLTPVLEKLCRKLFLPGKLNHWPQNPLAQTLYLLILKPLHTSLWPHSPKLNFYALALGLWKCFSFSAYHCLRVVLPENECEGSWVEIQCVSMVAFRATDQLHARMSFLPSHSDTHSPSHCVGESEESVQ